MAARTWTLEQRQQQRDRIRRQQPWLKSTGPQTLAGKQLVSLNALKIGQHTADLRAARRQLATIRRQYRTMLALLEKLGT